MQEEVGSIIKLLDLNVIIECSIYKEYYQFVMQLDFQGEQIKECLYI